VIKEGEITWPPPPPKLSAAPAKPKATEQPPVAVDPAQQAKQRARRSITTLIVGGLALLGIGTVAPPSFTANLTVFVLACFVGWQVVWNVTPALHTPLMSVTNAISSVIVIGALLQVSNESAIVVVLALVAIFITTINIFGGFYVTQRMLQMFRKD
jgi:NAD(P) transhydrogenase subunit alpha